MNVRSAQWTRALSITLILAWTAGVAGCSSPESSSGGTELSVAGACGAIRDLHNDVVAEANAMAAAEVGASDIERATIVADGFDAMIAVVANADLVTEPAELVAGLEERRDAIVTEMRAEASTLRADWPVVSGDDRSQVVADIFVWGEKLMSEVELRAAEDTPQRLIDAATAAPECRHVLQLP